MTNANEMAQKGFDTGFIDANDNELHVGDYVRICGHIGKIVFSCGAFGIFIADEVPWDALEESEPYNSFYNHWVCQTANATYHLYMCVADTE